MVDGFEISFLSLWLLWFRVSTHPLNYKLAANPGQLLQEDIFKCLMMNLIANYLTLLCGCWVTSLVLYQCTQLSTEKNPNLIRSHGVQTISSVSFWSLEILSSSQFGAGKNQW
jgi:hypothetical protein